MSCNLYKVITDKKVFIFYLCEHVSREGTGTETKRND